MAAGTAAAGNLVTVSGENKEKYNSHVHGVDFNKPDESHMFGFNVVLGMILDRKREKLVEGVTEKLGERIAQASGSGRARLAQLLEVKKTRVELGWNVVLGTVSEWGKKVCRALLQRATRYRGKTEARGHPFQQSEASRPCQALAPCRKHNQRAFFVGQRLLAGGYVLIGASCSYC